MKLDSTGADQQGAASSAILVSLALCFLLHRENKKLDAKALEGIDTDFRYTL